MSAPLVVSIPHQPRPRRSDAPPEDGPVARGHQRAGAERRRRALGGQSHDLSRPRDGAGGDRTCRCRGRSCAARSRAAVAAAALCRSGAGRDPQQRQAAADQARTEALVTHSCASCARRLRSRRDLRPSPTATGSPQQQVDSRNTVASASAKPSDRIALSHCSVGVDVSRERPARPLPVNGAKHRRDNDDHGVAAVSPRIGDKVVAVGPLTSNGA